MHFVRILRNNEVSFEKACFLKSPNWAGSGIMSNHNLNLMVFLKKLVPEGGTEQVRSCECAL